jgi:hypothetical protein
MQNLSHTTNKSDRDLGNKFDIKDFNKKFEENDKRPKSEKIEIKQDFKQKETQPKTYNKSIVDIKVESENEEKTESILSELDEIVKAEQEDVEKKLLNNNKELQNSEILQKLNKLPHQKPIGTIINDIQILIVKIIQYISDGKNPFSLLFSSLDNHFSIALFLIGIGLLILFMNNILSK